jgi:hypothetical protein
VKLHNVDKALTPEPTPDQWADHDEPTENYPSWGNLPSSTANILIVGRRADDHFAAAHTAGAELRQARRQRAEAVEELAEANLPPLCSRRVGRCAECGHYGVVDGWHASGLFPPCGGTVTIADEPDVDAFYERLALAAAMSRKQHKQRQDVPPEWREPPNYPGYELHSVTRELRTQDRDTVGKDGRVRHLSARVIKAHNGAYSLSVNGVKSTRGIQVLWDETFSALSEKKKTTGEWETDHYHTTPPQNYSYGVPEWIGDGGARIVTRPK